MCNVQELESLLCLCKEYQRFVSNSCPVSALLRTKLKMGEPRTLGTLTKEEQNEFETWHDRAVSAPIPALPRPEGNLNLDTDACIKELVFVLMREKLDAPDAPLGFGQNL